MGKSKKYLYFTILCFIVIFNGFTNLSIVNSYLSILQILFVLWFIFIGRFDKAAFLHIIFILTSYSYYSGDDAVAQISYNYAKIRLFGPISISFLLTILIALCLFLKKGSMGKKNVSESFRALYVMLSFFLISGSLVGIIGFVVTDYKLEGVLIYFTYIMYIYVVAIILLYFQKKKYFKIAYDLIPIMLAAICLSIFVVNMLLPERVGNSVSFFFFLPLMIPALLYYKNIFFILIALFFGILNTIIFDSISGKFIILLIVFLFITIFLARHKSVVAKFPFRARILKLISIIIIICIPSLVIYFLNGFGGETKIVSKIDQVSTLFRFFTFSGSLNQVSNSPQIRLAELANILYEDLTNPIYLLFGRGYGGYYKDYLNIFNNLSLHNGAFSDSAILTGKFYTAHDTLVSVPMFHGFLGIYLLIITSWKLLRNSVRNYLYLSVIPFLLLAFYFNTLIGVGGIFLLFAANYNVYKD